MIDTSPIHQATAITDFLVFLVATAIVVRLMRQDGGDRYIRRLWQCFFGLTGLAALLGSIFHGFHLPPPLAGAVWLVLGLSFCSSMACLPAIVLYFWRGRELSSRAIPSLMMSALLVYLISESQTRHILYLSLFQFACTGFAMFVAWHLYRRGQAPFALVMISSILIAFFGGILQALHITLFDPFDWGFNAMYHLIEIVAILVLAKAAHQSLVFARQSGPKT